MHKSTQLYKRHLFHHLHFGSERIHQLVAQRNTGFSILIKVIYGFDLGTGIYCPII